MIDQEKKSKKFSNWKFENQSCLRDKNIYSINVIIWLKNFVRLNKNRMKKWWKKKKKFLKRILDVKRQ
jgi:hypothetical protein